MKRENILSEKKRLIGILKNNPGKHSLESLRPIIHVCRATMRKVISENNLSSLLKYRNRPNKKKAKPEATKFFTYTNFNQIY